MEEIMELQRKPSSHLLTSINELYPDEKKSYGLHLYFFLLKTNVLQELDSLVKDSSMSVCELSKCPCENTYIALGATANRYSRETRRHQSLRWVSYTGLFAKVKTKYSILRHLKSLRQTYPPKVVDQMCFNPILLNIFMRYRCLILLYCNFWKYNFKLVLFFKLKLI